MSVVANVALNVDTRGAASKLREVQSQAQQTERAFGSLGSAVTRLAATYIGLRTAQQAVQAGIQREESTRRLQFLAQGYNEVAKSQEIAARAGAKFGLSLTESNQQFAQLYGRLRPLNVTINDIEAAFVGFNTAAKVSGATAAESAGALLQLTQALGSGVLRGQELNSVLEQAPGLVIALTKELNAPISEIRELAEQGKITSDVVIRALKRAGTEGADELAAAMNGPAQAVKNLQNEFEDFQVAASQDLIPAVTEAVRELKGVLESLGPVIRAIGGIAAQTFGTIADLINAATKPGATAAAISIRGGRLPLAGFGGMTGAGELFKGTSGAGGVGLSGLKAEAATLAKIRRQPVTDVLLELMQNRLKRMEAPAAPTVSTGAPSALLGTAGGKDATDKAAREAKRLAEELKRSLETGDKLGVEFSRQIVQLGTAFELDKKRNEIQFQYEDRARQISELKNAEQRANLTALNTEIRRLETINLEKQAAEDLRDALEGAFRGLPSAATGKEEAFLSMFDQTLPDAIEKIKKNIKDLTNPVNQIIGAAEAIGDAFSSSFRGIVSGSMTAQQAFANFFQSIANHFIDMAAKIAAEAIKLQAIQILQSLLSPMLGGLFGGAKFGIGSSSMNLPGLEGAGALTPPGGKLFPTGLFAEGGMVTRPTMGMIGEGGEAEYVIPASKMRGAMNRYAAGARGASVIPAGSDGGDGMAATMTAPAAIDVRYTVERINSVDYVTADQFQRGMQQAASQGAARGEQRALATLRQNTTQRRRIGL